MKKLLLVALITLSVNATFSQIYQGQWMVGGNVAFSSSKISGVANSQETNFNISPNVGYFFIDNLAGGVRIDFTSSKEEGYDAFTNFAAGPFLRYYFLPAAQKVNVFLDGDIVFGSAGSSNKVSYNRFQFMAGPAIFLNPNVALEIAPFFASAGGDAYKVGTETKRQNTFGVNIGFQIHLGSSHARTTMK